tara:strand:- start:302 stop:871 length:570 start_codon:yes stop_codon:yes gene_type:complete
MNKFGGWAIQESCFNLIKSILPEGKTILELGSGHGTDALSKYYNMISIENQPEWVGVYNSHYIEVPIRSYSHTQINTAGLFSEVEEYTAPDLPGDGPNGTITPLQKGWYDYKILFEKLKDLTYDLILVDGPNGSIGRGGFLKHLDLFNTNVPIVIDDISREPEKQLMIKVSETINRPYKELDWATGYIL